MSPLKTGDMFLGRFEVVSLIGAGGMGAVYEVVDHNTHRHRALKMMRPEVLGDDGMRERFEREAKVSARIESEHVAEVIDAGVDEATGAPYIVLELLKGEELAELVKERGSLSSEEVVLYLSQVAVALDKAHAAGVVHRDLKPENLFVTYRDDGSPRMKILDFGIAKTLTGTVGPQTKGVLGTPLYMSPEQMHGETEVSAQTDLFALAHIAYTLLVGEPFWRPEEESALGTYPFLVQVMKGPPEPAGARAASRRHVTLPAGFDRWFATATAPEPRDRHPSATAMIAALADLLDDASEPVRVGEEPPVTADSERIDEPAPRAPSSRLGGGEKSGGRKSGVEKSGGQKSGGDRSAGESPDIPSGTGAPVAHALGRARSGSSWPLVAGGVVLAGAVVAAIYLQQGASNVARPAASEPTTTMSAPAPVASSPPSVAPAAPARSSAIPTSSVAAPPAASSPATRP